MTTSTVFSAEPSRRVAYASNLRWRIVWRRIGIREQSFREIARSLNVSLGTAFNVFKIFKDTGDVEPKHREYPGFIMTERAAATILAIVFENPILHLNEITQKIYEYIQMKGYLHLLFASSCTSMA